jgi:undecaprenyl-diphosphatase
MSWWEAMILGVIQGLTEFFPVSSSGHLVMGQALLGLEIPGILFDVVVHVATLLSVMVVYRKRLLELVTGVVKRDSSAWKYVLLLALATVPVVIVGFTLKDWFEARFGDPDFAATMVLVTGCVVWSSRWAIGVARVGPVELLPVGVAALFSLLAGTIVPFLAVLGLQTFLMGAAYWSSRGDVRHTEIGWATALFMGLGQALAIFPGITRSGTTVLAGLWRRIDPVKAAEFSFLMSIPAILGAAVLQVPDALREPLPVSTAALVMGFIAAAASGILAIRFFVILLKRQNFHMFAYYAWAAAGLFLLAARGGVA